MAAHKYKSVSSYFSVLISFSLFRSIHLHGNASMEGNRKKLLKKCITVYVRAQLGALRSSAHVLVHSKHRKRLKAHANKYLKKQHSLANNLG